MPGPMMTRLLTHERLKEVLDYDPETGVFVWKVRMSRKFPVGRKAGGMRRGTFYIRIDEADYTGAQLAWFYVMGTWPNRIKFVDGDKANCRLGNIVETFALPEKYDNKTPEGRAAYLRAHRVRYGDVTRDRMLRQNFGITADEYQAKHDAQSGCCAICGAPETGARNGKTIRLAVDHNHSTGAVRDLLCRGCNQLIGNAKEDIAVLEAAIAYLRRHEPETAVLTSFVPFHADVGMAIH